MDLRTAERLARKIEREDPRVQVTGYRRWPLNFNETRNRYELDCVDTRSGYSFTVCSPEDWDERRAVMDAYYAQQDAGGRVDS